VKEVDKELSNCMFLEGQRRGLPTVSLIGYSASVIGKLLLTASVFTMYVLPSWKKKV